MALNEYYFVAMAEELFNKDGTDIEEEPTATVKNEATTNTTSKKDTSKKSPAKGFGATGFALVLSACGAFGVTLFSKKKYE